MKQNDQIFGREITEDELASVTGGTAPGKRNNCAMFGGTWSDKLHKCIYGDNSDSGEDDGDSYGMRGSGSQR